MKRHLLLLISLVVAVVALISFFQFSAYPGKALSSTGQVPHQSSLPDLSTQSQHLTNLGLFQQHSSKQFAEPVIQSAFKNSITHQEDNLKTPELSTDYDTINSSDTLFMVHQGFNSLEDELLVENKVPSEQPDYWKTLYAVESSQGLLLYRPRNKAKHCASTPGPCGHHQLTVKALRDIGCVTARCKKDREDFQKSLQMSKQLEQLNLKRLSRNGYSNIPDYQKYLIHQQGANGLKSILSAAQGKQKLSRKTLKNMANNSSYSYQSLKKLGNKQAALTFLTYWQNKWENKKRIIALAEHKPVTLPTFSDYELQIALNMKFK